MQGAITPMFLCRSEAVSRLGHGAVIEDEDLLVQWRKVDNVLHDIRNKKSLTNVEITDEVELL
jgi:hypothetical protein